MYLTDSFEFDGKTYKATWIPGSNYNDLSPLKQAYAFCFDNKGQLLVQTHGNVKTWQVMGGSIETGETPEQTIIRELDEEVNVEVWENSIAYLGAQKVEDESGNISYQLRFVAKIKRLKPRKEDPDRKEIRKRKFINYKDYAKISGWGNIGEAIANQAAETLKIR